MFAILLGLQGLTALAAIAGLAVGARIWRALDARPEKPPEPQGRPDEKIQEGIANLLTYDLGRGGEGA